MNKKVALFLPRLGYGGITKNTLKLAQALKEKGYEVDVVTAQIQNPDLRNIRFDFQVICFKAKRVSTSLMELISYLRRNRPHALISAHYYANITAIWAKVLAGVSTRIIVTERCDPTYILTPSQNLKKSFISFLMRLSYPKADEVVAVSKGTAQGLSRLLKDPSLQVRVIYNPIFRDKILAQAIDPVNDPWFRENQLPVILSIGYLVYQKDFSTLIRAFASVRKEINARLVIIGEGRDRANLKILAQKLGVAEDVSINQFVENPYKYMARADLFVLSSRYEGMPNVLVEAVAVGTPSIATDCLCGPREILPVEALAPIENFEETAKKIINLLKDRKEAERLLKKAQANLSHFHPAIWLQQYIKSIEGQELD